MKKIKILSIRKNTNSSISSLEQEFVKRLQPHCKIVFEDIRQTYNSKQSAQEILLSEKNLWLTKLMGEKFIIALDPGGEQFDSHEFAKWLDQQYNQTSGSICFIIGSPYGFHPDILSLAKMTLTLSRMTFTHEIARFLLLEQIYRCFDIRSSGNYHK